MNIRRRRQRKGTTSRKIKKMRKRKIIKKRKKTIKKKIKRQRINGSWATVLSNTVYFVAHCLF